MDYDIPELFVCEKYEDSRGTLEKVAKEPFQVQEVYVAQNDPRVFRGMHMQKGQSKLVSVLWGKVYDYVIDLRPRSPDYKKIYSFELNCTSGTLYIPEGCAHGYLSSGFSTVLYQMDTDFSPRDYISICPYDALSSVVSFDWGDLCLSKKDAEAMTLGEFLEGQRI